MSTTGDRLRQVWIPRIGGPDVLELREAPLPERIPDGQALVATRAAGINFADIMARMGLYPDAPKLPAVVGYEVAGEVVQTGAGVDGAPPKDGEAAGRNSVRKGARVLAMTRFGGYSSHVLVPADQLIPIPEGLSFEKAAAIPVNYLTAWIMLVKLGNVSEGDRVLCHAAAGGVGQAALQICRWRKAQLVGTASASKHARLREAGAAHVIDYTTQDFEAEVMKWTDGKGVDIALDAVGGKSFKKSYRCLAPLGRLFMFGVSSFATHQKRSLAAALSGYLQLPSFKPVPLMNKNRGVFGVNLGHLWDRADELGRMLLEILDLVGKGVLDPQVDKVFPFAEAAAAHTYIQERRNFGKVLLTP